MRCSSPTVMFAHRSLAVAAMVMCGLFMAELIGCRQVIESIFAKPLGIPLCAWGGVWFAGLFLLTLSPAVRLITWSAIATGIIGLSLVAIQFVVLQKACRYCLIVDGIAMTTAAIALLFPAAAAYRPGDLRKACS